MLDFCGWRNVWLSNKNKQILWTRNSGVTESDNSGPLEDHTTKTDEGWYVYVPEDAQSDGVAVLQSEPLGPYTGQICFSFYYHIKSENQLTSPKLTVTYTSPQLIREKFNISSHVYDSWNSFNVTLGPNVPRGSFRLTTIVGQRSRADVAVDDISIKAGPCGQSTSVGPPTMPTPEPVSAKQWDCNFENPSCKWSNNGTGWKKTTWANSKLNLVASKM